MLRRGQSFELNVHRSINADEFCERGHRTAIENNLNFPLSMSGRPPGKNVLGGGFVKSEILFCRKWVLVLLLHRHKRSSLSDLRRNGGRGRNHRGEIS